MHAPPSVELVEPDDWGFYHPPQMVMRGFRRWLSTEFKHMPELADVENSNPLWERDLNLMFELWRFQDPKRRAEILGNNGDDFE